MIFTIFTAVMFYDLSVQVVFVSFSEVVSLQLYRDNVRMADANIGEREQVLLERENAEYVDVPLDKLGL